MTNTQVWDYAVGMIKVDGLDPTEEFKSYIEKEKRGEASMQDIKQNPNWRKLWNDSLCT